MHAAALTATVSVDSTEQFCHHPLQIPAFSDRMSVSTVGAGHIISRSKGEACANSHGLLPHRHVSRPPYETLARERGKPRLKGTDQQHAPEHLDHQFPIEVGVLWSSFWIWIHMFAYVY